MDKKDKKARGIFETIRQVDEQERRRADEENERELIRHEKQREEYAKKLAEDKIELLKAKQGMPGEKGIAASGDTEAVKYTAGQKFRNFIYHNKWWLGIALFFAAVAGFLVYDKLSAPKPDMIFMLLTDNTDIYAQYDEMGRYFDGVLEDCNDDGRVFADILYIPIAADADSNTVGLYESNLARLNAEFQMGQTMLVIADKNTDDLVIPEENLVDLEKLYPDNKNIKGYGFYLKGTDFAERIGFKGELPDDLYIGVRKVTDTLTAEKEMRKNYDIAMVTIDILIGDLSK